MTENNITYIENETYIELRERLYQFAPSEIANDPDIDFNIEEYFDEILTQTGGIFPGKQRNRSAAKAPKIYITDEDYDDLVSEIARWAPVQVAVGPVEQIEQVLCDVGIWPQSNKDAERDAQNEECVA